MRTRRRLLVIAIISLVFFFFFDLLPLQLKWCVQRLLLASDGDKENCWNFIFKRFWSRNLTQRSKTGGFLAMGLFNKAQSCVCVCVCGYWSERLLPLLHAVITLISLLSIVFPLSEEKGSRGRSIGSHWSISKRSPEWAHLAQKQTRST